MRTYQCLGMLAADICGVRHRTVRNRRIQRDPFSTYVPPEILEERARNPLTIDQQVSSFQRNSIRPKDVEEIRIKREIDKARIHQQNINDRIERFLGVDLMGE